MSALAIRAEPAQVVGRLTAYDVGRTITITNGGHRVTGVLHEVEHKREPFGGTLKTRVWLRAPGWSSFIDLNPAEQYEGAP